MKRKMTFLCMLASASTTLILPVLSEDASGKKSADALVELQPEVLVSFRNAVQSQVLNHLNAKVPLPERFSRVLRPMPLQYHDCEVVGIESEGVIGFRLVSWDRSLPGKPVRTEITTGKCNHITGEVLLRAGTDGEFVTASRHPLLARKPNT